MQTFLPYSDYKRSAQALDKKRLGKQRVEAYQILRTLLGITQGWANHPAVKMWKGHELELLRYGLACCVEWKARGYNDTVQEKLEQLYYDKLRYNFNQTKPYWLFDNRFITSHRSNLLRKDPQHYGQFGWQVSDDLPYFWPTKEGY